MEKQRKQKAALYIRVSTEEQALDGQSASAQAETLKQYCKAFDIEVADIYEDLGLSGKSLNYRIGLKRLMDDSTMGCFDIVLVWKISRLSRNLKDLLYLIDVFEGNNVHFASCSEKFDTSTPVGRMTLQLLGSIAEFERNTIVENVKLGLREFARKGGKAASLMGYDNIEKKLVINEREAEIVRLIFRLYTVSKMSASAIANHLNSLGYRTKRGSKFRSCSISYILHNPVYVGSNRHNINTEKEYIIKGVHFPIIDEESWNMAQGISPGIKQNKASAQGNSIIHIPVTCLHCNSNMKVFYALSKGKKYKYMRCSGCSNYINYEKLEKEVSMALINAIGGSSNRNAFYDILNSTLIGEQTDKEISAIVSEIKRLEASKARYLRLFENYKLSDTKTFIERIAEIENQIKALSVVKLECAAKDDKHFNELVEGLRALEPGTISQLSDCLVKSIGVNGGKAEIVLYL